MSEENESMASKGGKKAAANMTGKQRSERAKKAAMARWTANLPKVSHGSDDHPMRIGDIEIPCYVLDNGMRVITHRGLQGAMNMAITGSASKTADFVARFGEKGLDCQELVARLNSPIEFVPMFGRTAFGYEATVLADLCDLFLEARRRGNILGTMGERIAARCELLARGFARVGIIALVDEATGYQDARANDALAKILEAFVAKELQKWVRTFPPDFYIEMFRLRNLTYNGVSKRPSYVGHLTNDLVYSRLAPGVLEELKRKNPVAEKGRRKSKHFQWLTPEHGHPRLRIHLEGVVVMMKLSKDWKEFYSRLNELYPKVNETPMLPGMKYDESTDEKNLDEM